MENQMYDMNFKLTGVLLVFQHGFRVKKPAKKDAPHCAPSPLLTSYFAILHGQAKQHPLSQSPGVFRFFLFFL